jgi:hypothetical protein
LNIGLDFCGGDLLGFWKLDPDLQLEALALWRIRHSRAAVGGGAGARAPQVTAEDLRLTMTSPVSSGDLAWLWQRTRPRTERDRVEEWRKLYLDPLDRGEGLTEAVDALFVKH